MPFCLLKTVFAVALIGFLLVAASPVKGQGELREIATAEGVITIHYWDVAPDALRRQAQEVMMSNIQLLLDAALRIDALGDVTWSSNPRQLVRKLEEVVEQVLDWQDLRKLDGFQGFSDEVRLLLEEVAELDARDVRREGGDPRHTLYLLTEGRMALLRLQISTELGWFVNEGLLEQVGAWSPGAGDGGEGSAGLTGEALEAALAEWASYDPDAPLPPLELHFSLATEELLDPFDPSTAESPFQGVSETPSSSADAAVLERVLLLLEAMERRLTNLEQGEVERFNPSRQREVQPVLDGLSRSASIENGMPGVVRASDPALSALHLPAKFDVRFGSGTEALGLNAQLQLNEVMELLGRYPRLRVVCTGHADSDGTRTGNLGLSRKRAERVREYLLQSGVEADRVLMNFFGEERNSQSGSVDRRVEIAFFIE
jgi:outer membrane protein OmpA-like peptidoglycan-associated protein